MPQLKLFKFNFDPWANLGLPGGPTEAVIGLLKDYLLFAENQAENKKNFRKIDSGDFRPAARHAYRKQKTPPG